ncbi:hypothetical protein CLOLEP_00118 [[Clostridium] leptum DSM 753]|uniref:Uncharacterized protein n=1 Tax=[Clostridium] leptum DSM 753 TaxID=428125 RepID=A7VNJ4_9FIRM|nr:hypothetical protein CLOLEP_00118 [[Clostridium] leptum DSM 753]
MVFSLLGIIRKFPLNLIFRYHIIVIQPGQKVNEIPRIYAYLLTISPELHIIKRLFRLISLL